MTELSLEERSAEFATQIQATLDGSLSTTLDDSLSGGRQVVSVGLPERDRFVVKLEKGKMPLAIGGEVMGYLMFSMDQQLDQSARYLKTTWSKIVIYAKLDKTPLLRLEYDSNMRVAPIAHWQIHAERGAMSYMLSKAHQDNPRSVQKPHDFSSLHFPLGGERFRPCLEDVLQFLIEEVGVDAVHGWRNVVETGRSRWRAMQLRSAVRDSPADAASTLESLGYQVIPPDPGPSQRPAPIRKW